MEDRLIENLELFLKEINKPTTIENINSFLSKDNYDPAIVYAGVDRIVVMFGDYAYKIPCSDRGLRANNAEYENAKDKDFVAYVEQIGIVNKQEKLTDCYTHRYHLGIDDLPDETMRNLWQYKLNNRFQIGKDKNGNWKFFDYEDIKFYEK